MAASKRDFRPMFIGAAVNNLLRGLGAKASDGELSARWNDLIGPDTEMVKMSRGVKDRTLTIRAKNPAERLTISYRAPEMVEKVNAYFGYDAVLKIVVK